MNAAEIRQHTLDGLLFEITRERCVGVSRTSPLCLRNGDSVDRSLVRSLTRMLSDLQIYTEFFEFHFLQATDQFYSQESKQCLETMEIASYLRHAERRLHEESDRVLHYLDAGTKNALLQVAEKELVAAHIQVILERGFDKLMEEHRLEDLRRMFMLLQRVNALEQLRLFFAQYIKVRMIGWTMIA